MVWVSVPTENNDFLSASPGWSTAIAHNGGAHNFPLTSSYHQSPRPTAAADLPIEEDVVGVSSNESKLTAIRRQIMGGETIEFKDSASRIKFFMVKERKTTVNVDSVDQSSTISLSESSGHRSPLISFPTLSKFEKETGEQQRRESNRETEMGDVLAKKNEKDPEARNTGKLLRFFYLFICVHHCSLKVHRHEIFLSGFLI